MPGPPRKPTALKLIHGTRDKRKNTREPKPESQAAAPAWLSDMARLEWDRIAPELQAMGLLTGVDQSELAIYCQAYAELVHAEAMILEHGHTQVSSSGLERKSPWLPIRDEAAKRLHLVAIQFGFTPASRTKIEVPERPAVDDKRQYLGFA